MKVKWSGLGVTDGRGHAGGIVASKNKAGAYLKSKSSPTNPNTARQQTIRARMSGISKAWAGLNKGLQNAWQNFANAHPTIDQFGDAHPLSGIAMFIKINGVLLNNNQNVLNTPPANSDVEEISSFNNTVEAAASTITLSEFFEDPIPVNRSLEIWMTPGLSAGINNANTLFKFVGVHEAGAIVTDSLALPVTLQGVQAAELVKVRGYLVNTLNGFKSGSFQIDVTVSA